MARQKTVFNTSEVFHLWANGETRAIRNAGGNVSAASGRLYSYGSHWIIGAFVSGFLFWNRGHYSNTTTKHSAQAWQALPSYKRAEALRVPAMSESSLRDTIGMARACIAEACENLEKAQKARQNRPHYLSEAASYIKSARALFTLGGDKKSAADLPTIGEDDTKEQTAAILRAYKSAEYLAKAREFLARVAAESAQVARNMETQKAGFSWPFGTLGAAENRAADLLRLSESCADLYKKAGKKPAPAAVKAQKLAREALAIFTPLAHAEFIANCEKLARDALPEVFAAMRRIRAGDVEREFYYAQRYLERCRDMGADCPEYLAKIAARFRRILAATSVASYAKQYADYPAAEHVRAEVETRYAMGAINKALAICPEIEKSSDAASLRESLARIEAHNRQIRAAAIEAQRDKIEAWRSGASNYAPHGVPTMARIRGADVETSRGARVPLSHAVRLVRMAERIAARGGQQWEGGSGPAVGHFRVQSIGPDFSAVIGCHEFSAEESRRIIGEIKAHAAFASEKGELAEV